MNESIVPNLSRANAREKITVQLEQWKNFAQRITKNPFVKNFLFERDRKYCAWCDKKLEGVNVIHHTTYEHHCDYGKAIRISSPTVSRPNKTRLVPDCKSCNAENNDRFLACMSKLVVVHLFCNKKISNLD